MGTASVQIKLEVFRMSVSGVQADYLVEFFMQKLACQAGDCPVAKNACCSSPEPEFSAQQPSQLTHNHLQLQLQGIPRPLASMYPSTYVAHTHRLTRIYINYHVNSF